jgi:peptide/nickel transport system permease protein
MSPDALRHLCTILDPGDIGLSTDPLGIQGMGRKGGLPRVKRSSSRHPAMPPLIRYILRRIIAIPLTLVAISATLYGIVMLAPPEERAQLYLPPELPSRMTEQDVQRLINKIIREQGLTEPYPIQYSRWAWNLIHGRWGWSPTLREDVLAALLKRLPATGELTLYSFLLLLPMGVLAGAVSGWRRNTLADHNFRLAAFLGTSIPPFILGLLLLTTFYVGTGWFPPERLSLAGAQLAQSARFRPFTGLMTIDGLLNGQPGVSLDALRHLVLPVLTLSLMHWATLGRVTRASMIQGLHAEYVTAARAHGMPESHVVFHHALRNALIPALTSSALAAASLITGVFVVEVVFAYHGLSEIAIRALTGASPDAALAVGFSIFSVILVLPIMLTLEIAQAALDPRIRQGITEA